MTVLANVTLRQEPKLSTFPVPNNDAERTAAISELGILNSGTSPEFDAVTRIAADILDCPIALISIVAKDEQWFKSNVGLGVAGTPREVAFCTHTIMDDVPLIVPDARSDDRFKNNPLVLGEPNIVFYAGVPICLGRNHNLGTLCVIDSKPRELNVTQVGLLRNLAKIVEAQIKALQIQRELKSKTDALERSTSFLEQIKKLTGVGGWELELDPLSLTWTDETKRIHEVSEDYLPQLETAIDFYAPEARSIIQAAVESAMNEGIPWDLELPLDTAKGNRICVRAAGAPIYKHGTMTSLIGAFQDISEQKRVEERIRSSEKIAQEKTASLLAILDNMDEGVSVFDANGRLVIWNARYLEIFGKPTNEVRTGVAFRSLLEMEQSRDEFHGDIDRHIEDLTHKLQRGETAAYQFQSANGKSISSMHAPLPGGGWVGTHNDITEQVMAAEVHKYASFHDALTGLPNRLAFNSKLEEIEEKATDDESIALLLVDLDRFKEVNDTNGHQAGDVLLTETATRLQGCMRKDDMVARLGGDEFACVIVCKTADAIQVAEDIASMVNTELRRPFEILGKPISIGGSVGISVASTQEFSIDSLTRNADEALYKVKECCRGGYHVHDTGLMFENKAKREKASIVRSAVRCSALGLDFQPIFALNNGSCVGVEALLRWRGTDAQALSPEEIIRISEEQGTISEIGKWVISESIKSLRFLDKDQRIAVNVSPRQLGSGSTFDQVVWALNEFGVDPSRLELEITENVPLNGENEAVVELFKLKSLGVKIALDDFGTGFASLSYLQNFPFDSIKIDRSFVSAPSDDALSLAIVRSVTSLANDLAVETTAEGIETHEQLARVQSMGCTYGQGFYIARPSTIDSSPKSTTVLRPVA